jgi:hypothetical protein
MLEVATRSWCIRNAHEQNRVDVLGSGCLVESGAISVDVEERISGRKGTKGCLHYRLDIGRIQDDESVDGHLSQARRSRLRGPDLRSHFSHKTTSSLPSDIKQLFAAVDKNAHHNPLTRNIGFS